MVGKNPKTEFYFMTYDIWQHSTKYFQFLIQLCLFVYIHSMVALVLQQQSWVVATETYDLKPKYIYHLTHCRKCLPTIGLRQCFPNFNLHMNYLGILLKYRFWISRSWGGAWVCISDKLPGDAPTAGPWITLWFARAYVCKEGKRRMYCKGESIRFLK